jgi:hypothetical protein
MHRLYFLHAEDLHASPGARSGRGIRPDRTGLAEEVTTIGVTIADHRFASLEI